MISEFKGKYEFLSDTYYCSVRYDGWDYNCLTKAFYAALASDPYFVRIFRNYDLPAWKAKEYGRRFERRADWKDIYLQVLADVTRSKFTRNPGLARQLLETGDQLIEFGNTWHDNILGNCHCLTASKPRYGRKTSCDRQGQNETGKIIMRVRTEISLLASGYVCAS